MNFIHKTYRSETDVKNYHVHLYYDGGTKLHAANLHREIDRRFGKQVQFGRWRDQAPQGPHPVSHFQVTFPTELFDVLVPFLALNRGDLHILLHPNTGNGYEDHTKNVMWIGPSIPLAEGWMQRNQKRMQEATDERADNT